MMNCTGPAARNGIKFILISNLDVSLLKRLTSFPTVALPCEALLRRKACNFHW